ncbi:E3 ubiquitin-protein ligase RING1 [Phytophthora cinnamomi]|uniref:E3 ubiquitin-protein ligase RING1 n=1 Tax=Phytophthora cinnamomi TaxID=4785 RepID=UPI00355A17CE|nr:E3 ubiquitin-protein ligase RING1 [Phytophthora cinnamomi]
MVVLRPGSSVLKPGVRERQRELETVITKYELLLAIGRTKNADFESIDLPQIIFRLGECRLCLVRLQRTAWQIDQQRQIPAPLRDDDEDDDTVDPAQTMHSTHLDMLEKTRRLYQLPEVARSSLAMQGEVQVLIETGELFTFCGDHAHAMAAYAEAIRLCYNIEDEATEAILTSKLRKLQHHADAAARMEALMVQRASDGDNNADSERRKLKAAFEKVADANGLLVKGQLEALAGELGMHDALSNSELDEMWGQLQQNDKKTHMRVEAKKTSVISFETFWRWWVSDAVYDFMRHHASY